MDSLAEFRRKSIQELENKIKTFEKKNIPACWYGIACKRIFSLQFNHYFVFKKDNRNLAVPELNQHCEESPKNYRCEHCGQMIENSGTDTKHLGRNHAKVLENKLNLQLCIAIQEPT